MEKKGGPRSKMLLVEREANLASLIPYHLAALRLAKESLMVVNHCQKEYHHEQLKRNVIMGNGILKLKIMAR